ncbi:MAG TPA: hypothetical protein VGZ23_16200 [bacterium]|nr:hypothetical protein [bacterium]
MDRQTVERVASYYPPQEQAKDDMVFSEAFRKPIRARRYLEMKDLLRIADWKSPRPKPLLRSNSAELLQTVSRKAFAERDPEEAIRHLDRLRGVSVRMASAILTIYEPDTYTTLDQNAWRSLARLGYVDDPGTNLDAFLSKPETYAPYLATCRNLATDCRVSLRTLDKCLWVLRGRTPAEFFGT